MFGLGGLGGGRGASAIGQALIQMGMHHDKRARMDAERARDDARWQQQVGWREQERQDRLGERNLNLQMSGWQKVNPTQDAADNIGRSLSVIQNASNPAAMLPGGAIPGANIGRALVTQMPTASAGESQYRYNPGSDPRMIAQRVERSQRREDALADREADRIAAIETQRALKKEGLGPYFRHPQEGGLTPVQQRGSAEEEARGIARTLAADPRFKNDDQPLAAHIRGRLRQQFNGRLPEGVIQGIALDAANGLTSDAPGGMPTEWERKAGFFYPQAANAAKVLDQYSSPGAMDALSKKYGSNYTQSEEFQVMDAAAIDLYDAYLRLTTGATYSAEEMNNAHRQFVPMTGDKPALLEWKRKRRQQLLQQVQWAAKRAGTAPGAPDIDDPFEGQSW